MSEDVWTEPWHADRERQLADLQKRYAWFGVELQRAHGEGKIDSEAVRFFIASVQPFLHDADGEPVLNSDGEPEYDRDAEPIYYGRAQAYSYVGQTSSDHPRPERTVAGQVDVSLQLLDQAESRVVLKLVCEDLNAAHARELDRERNRENG